MVELLSYCEMTTRLGQHFLRNAAVMRKMIAALELAKGDFIVEIGAGHGELTLPLGERCMEIGCKIFAIEKDENLMKSLTSAIETRGLENLVTVASGDALRLLSAGQSQTPYKLIGNLPYYLTGRLLRLASGLDPKPERCVFTVQKEVAERIAAGPPKMNRLAASVQFWAEPRIAGFVPKKYFAPPPEVDSAVLLLETKRAAPDIAPERYYAAVRTLFAQPRKTILNNLAEHSREKATNKPDKNGLSAALAAASMDPKDRPQDLAVEDIIKIAEAFF